MQHERCLAVVKGGEFVVFPSVWYEGCSMVEIEAESLGVPLVATDLGFSSEAVEEGVNGCRIPLGDVNGFVEKIRELWDRPGLCRQMGENALKYAQGDYIFLADQDDVWIDGKVQNCLKVLENSNCDLVVTDAIVTDNNLNIIKDSYFEYCHVKNGFLINLLKSRYVGACMAFHRRMLDVYLPIPGNSKYIVHDYWIACISELKGKVILLHEPLMYYRRHAGTASQGIEKRSKKGIWEKLYKRIYICIYIVQRIKSL